MLAVFRTRWKGSAIASWIWLILLVGIVGGLLVAVQAVEDGVCTASDSDTGECLADSEHNNNYRPLTPSDLPLPQIFDGFDGNTTVTIADRDLTVLHGSILQQGHASSDGSSTNTVARSSLAVLPGLIPRSVVAEILTLLRGHENADQAGGKTSIVLDADPDSVDAMTSQEFFLDNDSMRQGDTSKSDPGEDMEGRRELREQLRKLTDEYAYEILQPFLREWYGPEICGRPGRACTPCYSLLRRYRAGERQSHAPHNDAHSFVTVVVSLTDYGAEYKGGLYVSTKHSERNYVQLNRGDAVAHQGTLYHGVRVLDERDDGGPSERWSWILWFRDSDTCQDFGHEWHNQCAHAGNPTCMYLKASTEKTSEGVVEWNQKASDAGHGQASVKMAYAYLKVLPTHLIDYNDTKAQELFQAAIDSSNEPDGHYGMATLLLAKAKNHIMSQPDGASKRQAAMEVYASDVMPTVLRHLEEAAKGGHVFAMFNLGICHTFGYASENWTVDYELAIQWFEASGMPEGFFAKAMYLETIGKEQESQIYQQKAATLGFGRPWRKPARERNGYGGSSGPKLNLHWPPTPNGVVPPEW